MTALHDCRITLGISAFPYPWAQVFNDLINQRARTEYWRPTKKRVNARRRG
ncbi:UNVERIFIED_CONTAM: hypothetical protein FKN15_040825 [Acipenser sinensis]